MATECGLLLANTRMYLCQLVSLVRTIQSRFSTLGDFEKACILKELGHCLLYAGGYSEALESLRKARDIFKPMGHLSDPSWINALHGQNLSSVFPTQWSPGIDWRGLRCNRTCWQPIFLCTNSLELWTHSCHPEQERGGASKIRKVSHIFQTCWISVRRGAGLGEFWIRLPEPGRLWRRACSIWGCYRNIYPNGSTEPHGRKWDTTM